MTDLENSALLELCGEFGFRSGSMFYVEMPSVRDRVSSNIFF